MKVSIRQIGLGMIQQMRHVCPDCHGSGRYRTYESCENGFVAFVPLPKVYYLAVTGEIISERDKCPQCTGNKVTQEKKVLEVHVEKGMQHNQKIMFEGQADEAVSLILKAFVPGFEHLFFFYMRKSISDPMS